MAWSRGENGSVYRLAIRALMAEVSGGRVSGRSRLGWLDDLKVSLGSRV